MATLFTSTASFALSIVVDECGCQNWLANATPVRVVVAVVAAPRSRGRAGVLRFFAEARKHQPPLYTHWVYSAAAAARRCRLSRAHVDALRRCAGRLRPELDAVRFVGQIEHASRDLVVDLRMRSASANARTQTKRRRT